MNGFVKMIEDAAKTLPPTVKLPPLQGPSMPRCTHCQDKAPSVSPLGFCHDCQRDVDRGYSLREKAGRLANSFEGGKGTLTHAIIVSTHPAYTYSREKSACNTQPGKRSAGWVKPFVDTELPTCRQCLAKIKEKK